MLDKKVTHKKLRQKAKKEPNFLKWLHNQNNIVCFACGGQDKLECHHIKSTSTDEKDDKNIIMLCGEKCHRNGLKLSAHSTPKKFRETYSIETQLEYAGKLYDKYLRETASI